MKIAVWVTDHEISNKVCRAVYEGLPDARYLLTSIVGQKDWGSHILANDVHIAYGILRGCADVFREAERRGKPWFNIDNGYWKPGHYKGYYRVSLRGTQQTTFKGLEPDYARFNNLGICINPLQLPIPQGEGTGRGAREPQTRQHVLVCPPTEAAAKFYRMTPYCWDIMNVGNTSNYRFRIKGCDRLLQDDLDWCDKVLTFNSSVGWEALRQGIEVQSDPNHSIVGTYQKLVDKPLHTDLHERHKLFAIQSSLQLTLNEMRQGKLWPLLQLLLASS